MVLSHKKTQLQRKTTTTTMTTQPCSCCYRFSLYDIPELVLLDGHLIYGDSSVRYALWTYDYDIDSSTYEIDGYIEFKQEFTPEEVQAKHFFMENACLMLSLARPEDIEYYNAIHASVRAGWQPSNGAPVRCVTPSSTPDLTTDEVLPPQCHELPDLYEGMQDDDSDE